MSVFFPDPQLHVCLSSGQKKITDLDDCNCCTVTATAYALNILWDEAQALLKRMGRQRKKGFSTWKIAGHNLVKPYGTVVEAKWLYNESGVWNGRRAGMTVKTFLRACDHGKRYLITVSGHAMAVVDGRLCDARTNLNRRVRYAFEVTPKLQRPGAINLPVCVNKNLTSVVACEKVSV
jgi:hypothetical protein